MNFSGWQVVTIIFMVLAFCGLVIIYAPNTTVNIRIGSLNLLNSTDAAKIAESIVQAARMGQVQEATDKQLGK